MTGKLNFRVKESDFIVSFNAVVWGVVINMEDGVVGLVEVGVNRGWRCVSSDICSSDVPIIISLGVVKDKRQRLTRRSIYN